MRAEIFILNNGLDVVFIKLSEGHHFRLILNVPVGAFHDPVGKEGLSHLFEHSVFCGSANTSEEDLYRRMASIGGE